MSDRIASPQNIATKLADVAAGRNVPLAKQIEGNPRLVELLWTLEWHERQPGGLEQFFNQALEHVGEAIMPPEFLSLTPGKDGRFSNRDLQAICENFPSDCLIDLPTPRVDCLLEDLDAATREALRKKLHRGELIRRIQKYCREEWMNRVGQFFARFLNSSFPESMFRRREWRVFCDLPARLIDYIDHRAEGIKRRIAQTRVTQLVFEAADFAMEENAVVDLEGDTRFGKSESSDVHAEAHPGRERIVRTPSSGGLTALQINIGESMGLDVSDTLNLPKFKRQLQRVLRHCGKLVFVFDEAHFLVPHGYSKSTTPARMNWVRTEIIDRDLPCIFVTTPQASEPLLEKFSKKTGYAMEQWIGRKIIKYTLPTDLSEGDIEAVARVHFPHFSNRVIEKLASRAMQDSDRFLHAMTAIAKRASFLARRAGRPAPTEADIETASGQVMNGVVEPIDPGEQIQPQPVRAPIQPAPPDSGQTAAGTRQRHRQAVAGRAIQPISSAPLKQAREGLQESRREQAGKVAPRRGHPPVQPVKVGGG